MEALLAAGLINLGRDIVGGVFGSGTQSGSAAGFSQALDQARSSAQISSSDSASLQTRVSDLGRRLAGMPQVMSFTGGEAFKVLPDGNGFVVERADGTRMRLPKNSPAESCARDLNACNVARQQLEGKGTVPLAQCVWEVPALS